MFFRLFSILSDIPGTMNILLFRFGRTIYVSLKAFIQQIKWAFQKCVLPFQMSKLKFIPENRISLLHFLLILSRNPSYGLVLLDKFLTIFQSLSKRDLGWSLNISQDVLFASAPTPPKGWSSWINFISIFQS